MSDTSKQRRPPLPWSRPAKPADPTSLDGALVLVRRMSARLDAEPFAQLAWNHSERLALRTLLHEAETYSMYLWRLSHGE
jgi:hypothetical protein